MVSYASSSTTTSVSQGYDVFLSFRGEDTRTGFTSHLYDALIRKRIRTYKDDRSLEIGNFIAPALLEAIEASRFAVVILSSEFATSKWCLEEITKVVDCMEQRKLIVIPVFYHVSPSDVRHQRNCFEQGFANHEKDPGISPQKVGTWRSAFTKVGLIKGFHVTPDKNESEIVSEILKRILQDMHDASPVDLSHLTKGLVGIEPRVNEVIRILNTESSEVRFIGICGMSGIGKTTLAEVVFECIRNTFQESSFIENIKDISKDHNSDLCKLQQKILDDVLKNESIPVRSVKHGQTLLMTELRDLKVIIVLDDVNHADQFLYLAGGREWFGPGSRIIVTTTNADLLNAYGVNETFMCEELNGEEALRLFCQSAFRDGHRTHGYEKLSDDIVKFAGGLPIALSVYGSLLCGKEENYWKDILKKVQEYQHKEVLRRLEVGYVRLDRHQQLIFMYIACFLKGRDKELVADILTDTGMHSESGITDLINKFLITIKFDDCVGMHDLLQQMCWEILHRESQQCNGKLIAIKCHHDVLDILSSKPKESRTIEIINLESHKVKVDDCIDDSSCFSKMRKLKFLRISNIHFPQGLSYLSNDLRILEWYGCSLKSLPPMFEPKHIFQLEMRCGQLETLWEKSFDLPNLRSIDLSFSMELTKIPDLSSAPKLVKLSLKGCTKLKELHGSVLSHKRLEFVNLSGCTHLQNLGRRKMEMEALMTLILSGCSNLEYVPEFGDNMKCLEHLYVDGTNIKNLPESMGKLCNLRKLDASETSIQEIPSSIRYLKRLRLLRIHRCQHSSQGRGFLFSKMNVLSGIRELDLSYCNLSVVPDCIGLLNRLVNLDLSGNDLAFIPANISLLSNLRMLCLNNCKRLQSLPKLSVVNEDTLYGLQMRYNYIISETRVDVSKFHAASNNTSPIVSCLNCPKVAENESGGHLAERILNGYLQLRSKYWITPEAVFEIVGVGSELPSSFELLRADESLTLEGPWIGVAICAVVALHHIDAATETKYMVTAHVHVGENHWRIPVPISFLAAELENQLVFYWTRADDLQRTLDSGQKNSFKFSFSVEPQDCKLQVTKFGVRFIHKEDAMQLKKLEASTTGVVHHLFGATFSPSAQHPSEALPFLRFCQSSNDHDLTRNITTFICDYGKQHYALVDMHKIVKSLIEINQEVLSECKEEWSHTELFPLFYDYYRIIHGTSELYNGFLRLLKHDSWLSLKLALEQILAKSRIDNDYSYREMLEHLNDLEASEGLRFFDDFITTFSFFYKQTVAFSRHLNEEIQDVKKFKSVKTMAKVSSITIASIFSIMATYMCTDKLSQEMKGASSYSMWLHLIHSLLNKQDEWFAIKGSYGRELQIWEFLDCANVVHELKIKMATFAYFTHQNEKEMMIVLYKLEKMMDDISVTIEDMRRQAHLYSLDIKEVGITLNQFIVDSNLQLSVTGVRLMPPSEEQQFESPVSEAMTVMYRATLSLIHTGLQWYIHPCEEKEADSSSLLSCHSIIHGNINSIVRIISNPYSIGGRVYSLDSVLKVITCLHTINQEGFTVLRECKEEWRHHSLLFQLVNDYHKLCIQTSRLYNDFVSLLKGQCKSGLGAMLRLKEVVVNCRQDDDYQNSEEEVILDLDGDGSLTLSGDFMRSLAYVCKQTVGFTRQFDEEISELKFVKVLARVSSGLVTGVLSVMVAYMVDFDTLWLIEEKPLTCLWLHLYRCFSWKSPLMEIGRMVKNDILGIDFRLSEVKNKIKSFLCKLKSQSEGSFFVDKMLVWHEIDTAVKKMDELSVTIEEMNRHADTVNDDIIKAGISLEL
ncbi:disease resistance-like protein DSC1 [Bidens hawaiensis]|uniref:disease resistance-like protein DSC1 n=1 Tax=Bidens hawaiensis TaxID=980011 RepID=UPI00404B05E8